MKKILVFMISLLILTSIVGVVMAADTETATATVTVDSYLSVTVDKNTITFSNMDPGTGPTAATDNPITATIGAETNVDVDVFTKADAAIFSDGGTESFDVVKMEWSDADAGTYTGYTISDAEVCSNLGASGTCGLYHKISIPDEQKAGTYTTGRTITATTAA